MARPKEFDPKEALVVAMETFWERGFDATSLAAITANTGVQKASLYATYGDKRKLFVTALTHYQDKGFEDFKAALANAPSVRDGLRGILMYVVDGAGSKDGSRGCLWVNTAVELGPRDPEIAQMLAVHARRMETMVAEAIERAKQKGELRADLDARVVARFFLITVYGISVGGKGGLDPRRLEDVVGVALSLLDG